MTETLTTVAVIALILAIASAAAAVVIFFKLRIRSVMADLSGKTAQRSIEEIRSSMGSAEKNRRYRYFAFGAPAERGKTGKAKRGRTKKINYTQKLDDGEKLSGSETAIMNSGSETVIMSGAGETGVVSETPPTVVLGSTPEANETTLISSAPATTLQRDDFVLVRDIVLINTNERIVLRDEFDPAQK